MERRAPTGRLPRGLFAVSALLAGLLGPGPAAAQPPADPPKAAEIPKAAAESPNDRILAELRAINERLDRLERPALAQGLIPRDPKAVGPLPMPVAPVPPARVVMVNAPGRTPLFQTPAGQKGTGLVPHTDAIQLRATAARLAAFQPRFVSKSFLQAGATFPAQFDLREEVRRRHGRAPALTVRDQQDCGSCWAFAAVAALEGNHALKFGREIDPSEQFVLDCSPGDCRGATMDVGPAFLAGGGTIGRSEAGGAYVAVKQPCRTGATRSFRATAFGFVNPNTVGPPSNEELKQAIVDHGAVVVGINATPAFVAHGFAGGRVWDVVNESGRVNHAVIILGWDDRDGTWLMKNSWGPTWGERGFMRVKYGFNGIGSEACWVDAVESTNGPGPGPGPTPVPIVTDGYLAQVNAAQEWWQTNFPQFVPTKP